MDYGKSKITKKITVYGMVQGVGFRPFVYHIAQKYKIRGTVRNIGGVVEIIASSTEAGIVRFLEELRTGPGEGSEVLQITQEDTIMATCDDFCIIKSSETEEISILPPDLPVCGKCEKEFEDRYNRRFLHPFISCVSCGPRYTIMEKIPYDRENTSMKDFDMCPQCMEEYRTPGDRRFHAQTISCHDCGPGLIFRHQKRLEGTIEITGDMAFHEAVILLNRGGVIAVKGIGGYHFVCSPFMEDAVINLRKLKVREEKPFAVMFEHIESAKEYCSITKEEEDLLLSRARPIVLLYQKKPMPEAVTKGGVYCGAFLPYTPIQMYLLKQCGPLIMTSANLSDRRIIKEEAELFDLSSPFLDGVLYHHRRIVRSVDDSVARVIDQKPQLLRRSRGYVPFPVYLPEGGNKLQIFSAGSDMKAAFCLYRGGNAVVSQYFGDLVEESVLTDYETCVEDLSGLLGLKPDLAVCDLHPGYHSAGYARRLGIPVLCVQHHHAHICSVMAEHDIKGRVIGIAFDGTGYGEDGKLWGGEFMICEGAEWQRVGHLLYQPIIGGDASMRDAKKTSVCFLINSGLSEYICDDRKEVIQAAIHHKINTIQTSSMGRLFDAVAAILNISDENCYEGACAVLLEKEALLANQRHQEPHRLDFKILKKDDMIIVDPAPLLKELCLRKGRIDRGALALGFHHAIVHMMVEVCSLLRSQAGTNQIAFSGGVFQNLILTELSLIRLREAGFVVYTNSAVPPNDGGISLGQTYIGVMRQP